MIVGNFTPDTIETMFIGVSRSILPGQIIDIPDAEGNHVLDRFAPKGLVRMEWGSNEAEYREESAKRWETFWTKQITDFNQLNEKLKAEKKGYIYPTADIKAHAAKLGLELLQPWVMQRTDNKELEELRTANRTLTGQVQDMMDKLAELTSALGGIGGVNSLAGVDETKLRAQFKFRSSSALEPWVLNNTAIILEWPQHIRQELIEKWQGTYKGKNNKPWPLPVMDGDELGEEKEKEQQ